MASQANTCKQVSCAIRATSARTRTFFEQKVDFLVRPTMEEFAWCDREQCFEHCDFYSASDHGGDGGSCAVHSQHVGANKNTVLSRV